MLGATTEAKMPASETFRWCIRRQMKQSGMSRRYGWSQDSGQSRSSARAAAPWKLASRTAEFDSKQRMKASPSFLQPFPVLQVPLSSLDLQSLLLGNHGVCHTYSNTYHDSCGGRDVIGHFVSNTDHTYKLWYLGPLLTGQREHTGCESAVQTRLLNGEDAAPLRRSVSSAIVTLAMSSCKVENVHTVTTLQTTS
ncbi:uncharacterized protein LOC144174427 [Haemaphysalis longicornis]